MHSPSIYIYLPIYLYIEKSLPDVRLGWLASARQLTVRVVVLEYSQLYKKACNLVVCGFGGFENVLRDASISAIPI